MAASREEDPIIPDRDTWAKWFDADGPDRSFQVLVCMLVTNKARDSSVKHVMATVKACGWITPTAFINAKKEDMEQVVFPLGFQVQRVLFLRNTAKIIWNQYQGKIPQSYSQLMKLSGVGPKIALVTLHEGYKLVEGLPWTVTW